MSSKNVNRKVYTAEFKAKLGLEALQESKTINQIAQEHGVHPEQISRWKKEILENSKTLFEVSRGKKPQITQADPDNLYTEIGKLKVELEWLKKKSGMSLS